MTRRRVTETAGTGDVLAGLNSDDKRTALEAIRAKLAAELATAEGKAAAALAKELRAVVNELHSMPGGREVSKVDDLRARREARRANAARG